jgi:hypothetical protein
LTQSRPRIQLLGMNAEEQVDMVTQELLNVCSRAVQEFDMITLETLVGILAFVSRDLIEGSTVDFDADEEGGLTL